MSVKITLSYEEDQELETIKEVLHPYMLKVKVPKMQKGTYKKAYFDIETTYTNTAKPK